MKSRSIFIVLLFSLFLNIGHDFFIKHQVEHICTDSQIKTIEKKSTQNIESCHHFFHFVAIVSYSDFLEKKLVTKRTFTSQDFPLFITYKNSFKPPKA